MRNFDVIVIGGGPAGSTAAYLIAQCGLTVALVDRAVFPREKLCGGLLSGRSKKVYHDIFHQSWQPVIQSTTYGVAFYEGLDFVRKLDDYREINYTYRVDFDAHLFTMACEQGAIDFQGRAAVDIDCRRTKVTLADGTVLAANFIVGADGVFSRTARSLGLKPTVRENLGWCLETEIPKDLIRREIENPEIYFGLVDWGYGWVFPKRDYITVGVGGVYRSNRDLHPALDRMIRSLCDKPGCLKVKGHYLPFGEYLRQPGEGNVLLTGDAAGLIEPITGEGIALAMQSGQYAAQAIVTAAERGNPRAAYNFYKVDYENITSMIDLANGMKYILFPDVWRKLFTDTLRLNQGPIRSHMDLMNDEVSYRAYPWHLIKNLFSGYAEFFRLKLTGTELPGSTIDK